MLTESDVCIIVQGPLLNTSGKTGTLKTFKSIREFHPEVKIIFATADKVIPELPNYVTVIKIEDPGPVTLKGIRSNNVNRQINSTKIALRAIHQTYSLKIRSDIFLTKPLDFNGMAKDYERQSDYIFYSKRILVTDVTTKNMYFKKTFSNHVSDWLYFGLTSDLQKLFEIHEFEPKDATHVPAEIYIWSTAPSKRYSLCNNEEAVNFFINNARIVDFNSLGLKCMKKGYSVPFGINNFARWTEYDWYKLYKTRISPSGKINLVEGFKNSLQKILGIVRWLVVSILGKVLKIIC